MEKMLRQNGIESDSCYNGQEALDYLKHHTPSIIFMDHTMPGMNGLEVVKILKKTPNTATIPVLMFTAKSGEVYCSQARALGAIDVLPKKLEQKHIEQALTQLGMMPSQKSHSQANDFLNSGYEDINIDEDLTFTSPQAIEEIVQKAISNTFKSILRPHISERMYVGFAEQNETQKIQQNQHIKKLSHEFHSKLSVLNESVGNLAESFQEGFNLQASKNTSRHSTLIYTLVVFFAGLGASNWLLWKQNNELVDRQKQFASTTTNLTSQLSELKEELKQEQKNLNTDTIARLNQITASRVAAKVPSGEIFEKINLGEWEPTIHAFSATTAKNYTFFLKPDGSIVDYVPTSFYLEKNCFGEAFVEPSPGKVFRSGLKQLWYAGLDESTQYITPLSQKHGNEKCQTYAGEAINLQPLLKNDTSVTGVEIRRYSLNFSFTE